MFSIVRRNGFQLKQKNKRRVRRTLNQRERKAALKKRKLQKRKEKENRSQVT